MEEGVYHPVDVDPNTPQTIVDPQYLAWYNTA